MTKEQIQNELDEAYKKINKLKGSLDESLDADRIVRERFQIVLSLDVPSVYGQKEIPSWSEIFFEIGKIFERSRSMHEYIELINDVKWLKSVEEERQMKKRERRLKNGKN